MIKSFNRFSMATGISSEAAESKSRWKEKRSAGGSRWRARAISKSRAETSGIVAGRVSVEASMGSTKLHTRSRTRAGTCEEFRIQGKSRGKQPDSIWNSINPFSGPFSHFFRLSNRSDWTASITRVQRPRITRRKQSHVSPNFVYSSWVSCHLKSRPSATLES